MSGQPRVVDRRTINNPGIKCLSCCVAFKLGALENGVGIKDAVTWVPVWRTQAINGQMMMGLAIEPVCFDHLTVSQQTATDRGELVTGDMPDPEALNRTNEALKSLRDKGILP